MITDVALDLLVEPSGVADESQKNGDNTVPSAAKTKPVYSALSSAMQDASRSTFFILHRNDDLA
jgi:hypothetical protein